MNLQIYLQTSENNISKVVGSKSNYEEITRRQFSLLTLIMQNLLSIGAKKFGIISVPPIGCCPSQRLFNSSEGCLEDLNELAVSFHLIVGNILKRLSSEYEGMVYSLGNTFDMTMDVIKNPLPFSKFRNLQDPH